MAAFTLESALRGLAGGALIGLAASLALGLHGRVAGISNILGHAFDSDPPGTRDHARAFRLPFLVGLVGAGALIALVWPAAVGRPIENRALLAVAGVLVGVGTTLSHGCTSGHGVCGLSRGSPRSLIAVITFMAIAMATTFALGAWR